MKRNKSTAIYNLYNPWILMTSQFKSLRNKNRVYENEASKLIDDFFPEKKTNFIFIHSLILKRFWWSNWCLLRLILMIDRQIFGQFSSRAWLKKFPSTNQINLLIIRKNHVKYDSPLISHHHDAWDRSNGKNQGSFWSGGTFDVRNRS